MRKCSSTILYAACTFRPYKSTPVLKLFRTFTGRMTRGLSLRMVFSLLLQDTLLHSSPSPRDARLVHSTVPGPRIGNVLTIFSRDNHIASLSEMSLFTCSRMRILTTISCAQESASQGDLLVIENSEPPQGARVLTDEQSRLTPTDANG